MHCLNLQFFCSCFGGSCRTPKKAHFITTHRAYVSAPGTRRACRAKGFPRFGVAPRVGVKDSHSSVWPLERSVTHKRGFFDSEVGGHDGAYKGMVHLIVPSVGRKMGI